MVDLALQGVCGAVQLGLVRGGARHQVRYRVMTRDQALMGGNQVNRAEILKFKMVTMVTFKMSLTC